MTYPGGKGHAFTHIINQMPPHQVYIETHLGGGFVLANKKPALILNVGLDLDPEVIASARSLHARNGVARLRHSISSVRRVQYQFLVIDAVGFLTGYPFNGSAPSRRGRSDAGAPRQKWLGLIEEGCGPAGRSTTLSDWRIGTVVALAGGWTAGFLWGLDGFLCWGLDGWLFRLFCGFGLLDSGTLRTLGLWTLRTHRFQTHRFRTL